ncbi:hypothetical protein [Coleofasciculus sp. FACHB-T130]|uniref:hypothetical protein n=1 Tax=Cyanophyceae TaxID=3028117 RepID=UPI001685DDBE|nr:hypothetical protein [Coleofasciculus sp. FACHB-T130]MBD1878384.1 hypothetical protein [Coleofasciculus sp. FACHB-T130]
MPSAGYALDTIAELLAIPPAERTDKMAFLIKEHRAWFTFDAFTNIPTPGSYSPNEGSGLWQQTGGTMGFQDASSVAITGGFISGIAALEISSGGTGANNAAEARNNLGISLIGHNYQVNGGFYSALAGTSFSAVGRTIEMWNNATFGTGGAATTSRQSFTAGQANVPGNPKFFWRWSQTTGGTITNPELQSAIENAETLAGEYATVSFWAKAANNLQVSFGIRQVFGTGGSPSASVDTGLQTFENTSNWQKFTYTLLMPSVAGKTFGTDANSSLLRLRWVFPLSSTFTFDLADVKFEAGEIDTPVERLYDYDAWRIARYYQSLRPSARFVAAAANHIGEVPIPIQRIMRNTPAATLVNGGARVNQAAGYPATGSVTSAGGRFLISAAAAGDCYALAPETLILDARL